MSPKAWSRVTPWQWLSTTGTWLRSMASMRHLRLWHHAPPEAAATKATAWARANAPTAPLAGKNRGWWSGAEVQVTGFLLIAVPYLLVEHRGRRRYYFRWKLSC